MANEGCNISTTREYRKGNWTVSETLILIEAKKMDYERRMKRSNSLSGDHHHQSDKPAELRWKWAEDYCWRKGCFRSQNQCNDKWDNLMRDYKKVRHYERTLINNNNNINVINIEGSYWKMEKKERKERSLPTNMLVQIYQALEDVVERKERVGQVRSKVNSPASDSYVGYVIGHVHQPPPILPIPPNLMQRQFSTPPIVALRLPPPAPDPPPPSQPVLLPSHQLHYSQLLPSTVDSDTSEHSDEQAKRRRRSSHDQVGSAISKSASIIAEAIQASEEGEERRHRDMLSLHERRLKIEESNTEINRQGFHGLVDAINNLANSIHALASCSNKNPSSDPK